MSRVNIEGLQVDAEAAFEPIRHATHRRGAELERLVRSLSRRFDIDGRPLKTRPKGYDLDNPRIDPMTGGAGPSLHPAVDDRHRNAFIGPAVDEALGTAGRDLAAGRHHGDEIGPLATIGLGLGMLQLEGRN